MSFEREVIPAFREASQIADLAPPSILRGDSRPDLLRDEVLTELFRASAANSPDHLALTGPEGDRTYGQVDAQSDAIARGLMRAGVGPGDVIGLWMRRGQDLLVAQIAIAKSGAAWLPFDGDTPTERVALCMKDCGARGVLTSIEFADRTREARLRTFTPGDLIDPRDEAPVEARALGLAPDHAAYLIYTAGTTGAPKGVVVSHRSVCHCLRACNEVFRLTSEDLMYQGASLAFDLSLEEVWLPYLVGASLWVAPPDLIAQPDQLAVAIDEARVTVIDTVPTLLSLFGRDLPCVRMIVLGGETLPLSLVDRWARDGRRLFNTYGPTETTVAVTIGEVSPGDPITIGRPIANHVCFVADEQMNLLRQGSRGELLVGGPGVARGYVGRPKLTAEKFIANPFDRSGAAPVLYRTSDSVSIDPKGRLLFHGRLDDQYKIRGFRIEVGEIEAALEDQPGVRRAVVAPRQHDDVDRLVAFIIPDDDNQFDAVAVHEALGKRLPRFMTPSRFEIVGAFPTLLSGKLDRDALRRTPLSAVAASSEEQEQPRTETEAALLAAAQPIFAGQILPLDADFFDDLGGHSLLAARFVSAVRKNPNLAAIAVKDVYTARSLRAIAARLDGRNAASDRVARNLSFTPPPLLRRFLCGLAQAAALPLILGLEAVQWLGLFLASIYVWAEVDGFVLQILTLIGIYIAQNLGSKFLTIGLKWAILGKTKPGRYPLWGLYYYRIWLVNRLLQTNSARFLQGSPLIRWYLRALGAQVGRDAMIGEFEAGACDLISIGDRSCIGAKSRIANVKYIGDAMIVGRIEIGADVHVGNSCVFELGCRLEDGADLADLSVVTEGVMIGGWERWDGSPARKIGVVDRSSIPQPPAASLRRRVIQAAVYALAYALIPLLGLAPIFPAYIVVYDVSTLLTSQDDASWVSLALLAWPTAMALIVASAAAMVGLRWLLLPRRMEPGRYSVHSWFYVRRWIVSLGFEVLLETVSSLYATIFMPAWCRLLGAKIGRGSEISANLASRYDLVEIGENNFLGDEVVFGEEDIQSGWMILGQVKTGDRVFIGNSAVIPGGAMIEDDALIGVKSKLPEKLRVARGETYFGSPAMKLPVRERVIVGSQWTYRPPRARVILRGLFESFHVSLPTATYIVLGSIAADMIQMPAENGEWLLATGVFLVVGVAIAAAMLLLSVAAKWLLIGVYKPVMKPMWSFWAMRTEAVAVIYGGLAGSMSIEFLRGTPFLPWALRLYGAKVGKGVCMELTDITEFDCVEIGEYCTLNASGCLQTHLYEDRVMKVGRVKLGRGVYVGWDATVLYDTHIGDFARVGPLTLVMKGESLPAHTEWIGAPAISSSVAERPMAAASGL